MKDSILSRYGALGLVRLIIDLMVSRLFIANSRIMRRPFYIRGKKHIKIGKHFTAGVGLRLDAFPEENKICIEIGENVQVNDFVHICAVNSVKIGNNVLIASKVFISDHNHGSYGLNNIHTDPNIPPITREISSSPIVIEETI